MLVIGIQVKKVVHLPPLQPFPFYGDPDRDSALVEVATRRRIKLKMTRDKGKVTGDYTCSLTREAKEGIRGTAKSTKQLRKTGGDGRPGRSGRNGGYIIIGRSWMGAQRLMRRSWFGVG